MKKDKRPKYIISAPVIVEASEKRIIENSLVEVSAPITVHGKLVFRNCTIKNISGNIDIYGVLKIETCSIWTTTCFLSIQSGGEYQCDILDFNDNSSNFSAYISGLENGHFKWIENPTPVDKRYLDVLVSCISKHYGVEICDKCPTEYSDEKKKVRREARWIAMFLGRRMNLSTFEILRMFEIPHWCDWVYDEMERFVRNGDIQLWKDIAEITVEISKEIYWEIWKDQYHYPYRD